MMLSKLVKSKTDNNVFYATNKVGHIIMMDRRKSNSLFY